MYSKPKRGFLNDNLYLSLNFGAAPTCDQPQVTSDFPTFGLLNLQTY